MVCHQVDVSCAKFGNNAFSHTMKYVSSSPLINCWINSLKIFKLNFQMTVFLHLSTFKWLLEVKYQPNLCSNIIPEFLFVVSCAAIIFNLGCSGWLVTSFMIRFWCAWNHVRKGLISSTRSMTSALLDPALNRSLRANISAKKYWPYLLTKGACSTEFSKIRHFVESCETYF